MNDDKVLNLLAELKDELQEVKEQVCIIKDESYKNRLQLAEYLKGNNEAKVIGSILIASFVLIFLYIVIK